MGKLTFYMTPAYGRNSSKIIAAANEGRPKDQQLKDISDWERLVVKGYLQTYVPVYRKWEIEGEFVDRRTLKTYELLEDSPQKDIPVNMLPQGKRTFKRILQLNEKQVEWLKRIILFLRETDKVVMKKESGRWQGDPLPALFESQAKSVGDYVARMLVESYSSAIAQQDLKEIVK